MNVIDTADQILTEAIEDKISDIHLEPLAKNVRLRFRKDGKLFFVKEFNKEISQALQVRLKVMAGLDIANNKQAQDGKLKYSFKNRSVDLRFATLPTIYGEKIEIRILDQATGLLKIDSLKMPLKQQQNLLQLLKKQKGLFLVVGPTGSGKTTTLYALLQELNSIENNIITIEDPVEYHLEGINQIQVNAKAQITFASGLRAILRQDPDIILVGEIRDLETAEIALRAALTGHTVLGTLHTRNSLEAVIRLQDMGIPSFRIGAALRAVIGQRLVQIYCQHCQGQGCDFCRNSGYFGRQAIYEFLLVSGKIQETISKTVSYNQLAEAAILENWCSFKCAAEEMVRNKITSAGALQEFI